jgi:hypothetical protein
MKLPMYLFFHMALGRNDFSRPKKFWGETSAAISPVKPVSCELAKIFCR